MLLGGIRFKIAITFTFLVLIFGAVSGITYTSLGRIQAADRWNVHTYEVIDKAGQLLAGVIDQETGMRGFLVSGNEVFLEPYVGGHRAFEETLAYLLNKVSDNPAQQERLRAIGAAEAEWREAVAERAIALMRNPETMEDGRAIEASGAGKAMMDAIRRQQAEFVRAEKILLEVRTAEKEESRTFASSAILFGSVAMLVVAIIAGVFLARSIARPISRMTGSIEQLALGNNAIEEMYRDRRDEIGT
ncbi:MAG: CHASE3 domain-containing protein, partial [Pseudomonadota bacterium]